MTGKAPQAKLDKLTKEQEELMITVRDEYHDLFFSGKRIDKKKLTPLIHWLYEFCGLKKPKVVVVDSPYACQVVANRLTLAAEGKKLKKTDKLQYFQFSSYVNYSDYGWISFYDYFDRIGIEINSESFTNIRNIIRLGVYDMIQLDKLCIISQLPTTIKVDDQGRLHAENGPAIRFADDYQLFFWHGICIPREWIMNKESITRTTIVEETNAEKRRCIQEILGQRFVDLLDLEEIDSDVEGDKKLPLVLYKTVKPDSVTGKHIFFLKVTCPSTGRVYYSCVKECRNVWDAKAQMFQGKKIEIRHGDVGLLNLKKEFDRPITES